jgi:hypothetical protein
VRPGLGGVGPGFGGVRQGLGGVTHGFQRMDRPRDFPYADSANPLAPPCRATLGASCP